MEDEQNGRPAQLYDIRRKESDSEIENGRNENLCRKLVKIRKINREANKITLTPLEDTRIKCQNNCI